MSKPFIQFNAGGLNNEENFVEKSKMLRLRIA